MAWAVIASMGASAAQGIANTRTNKAMRNESITQYQKQLEDYNKQLKEMIGLYSGKRAMLTDAYGNKVSSLTDTIRQNKMQEDAKASRSGLAFSGTLYEHSMLNKSKEANALDTINTNYKSSLASLDIQKAKDVGAINESIAGINAQLGVLKAEAEHPGLWESMDTNRWFNPNLGIKKLTSGAIDIDSWF